MEDKSINAQMLMRRFNAIVSKAENIIFADNRTGVFATRNMDGWSKIRKFLYRLSTAYLIPEESPKGLYLFFSVFILVMTIYTLIVAQEIAWNPTVKLNTVQRGLLTVFFLLSACSFIEFLRDNRYPVLLKAAIIVVLPILCLIQSVSLLTDEMNRVVPLDKLVTVSFFTGAAFTPIFIFFLNTFVSILWGYILLIKYTTIIQSPLPNKYIEQLLEAKLDIGDQVQKRNSIPYITKRELEYIRKWSESNRDASEKRTLPTLVISGLIGFFISQSAFGEIIKGVFSSGSTGYNFQSFLAAFILPFILFFLLVFSKTLIALFKNIAVQSLIIETCIVAEFANESYPETKPASFFTFIADLWNITWRGKIN